MNLFCRFKRLWVKPFFHISQSPPMRQVPQVGSSRSEADHHDLLKDHLEVATFPGVQVTLTFVHMSIELWSTNVYITPTTILRKPHVSFQEIAQDASEPPTPHLRAQMDLMRRLDTTQLEAISP